MSSTLSLYASRENLEWLARATNWAKFTATASLGVIHKGHEKEALHLMSTYLPKESGPASTYSEGGGLYALGLIHANHGGEITEYLLNQLKEATNDVSAMWRPPCWPLKPAPDHSFENVSALLVWKSRVFWVYFFITVTFMNNFMILY